MPKAAITYFAIDLKLMPSGDMRILELVELENGDRVSYAGLSGMLPNPLQARNWVQSTIHAHTEALGVPIYDLQSFGYPAKNSVADHLGLLQIDASREDFDPDNISTYACILNHAHALNQAQQDYLITGLGDRVLVTNQNLLCKEAYFNKACFFALAHDVIPDLLPEQHLYAVIDGKVDAAQILDDFKGHSHVVIKQPENYKGMGVDIRPVNALTRNFAFSNADGLKKLRLNFPIADEDLLVVQEVITGQPVSAKNQAGKEGIYDPAIRVIATAWHSEGQTHVKCHGAYYKFPEHEVDSSKRRRSLVSNIEGKGPRGGVIPDTEKAHIYSQIESRLPPLFEKLLTIDPAAAALELLHHTDQPMQMVGLHLAERIDPQHYVQSSSVTLEQMRDAIDTVIPSKKKWGSATALGNIGETYSSDVAFSILEYMMEADQAKSNAPKGILGKIKSVADEAVYYSSNAKFALQEMYRRHPRYSWFTIGTVANAMATIASIYTYSAYNKWDYGSRLKQVGDTMQLNTSYQDISVAESTLARNNELLKSAAIEQGQDLCVAIEPYSEAQSKKLLADFHRVSPQSKFIGVRLNDSFHIFSTDCPENFLFQHNEVEPK